MCHLGVDPIYEQPADCGIVPILGWLFAASLSILSVSASKVLILSQSAVLTVALMTCALPLGNIFWSFFRLPPASAGEYTQWSSIGNPHSSCVVSLPTHHLAGATPSAILRFDNQGYQHFVQVRMQEMDDTSVSIHCLLSRFFK